MAATARLKRRRREYRAVRKKTGGLFHSGPYRYLARGGLNIELDSMPDVDLPLPFEAYAGDKPYVFVSYAHKDGARVYTEIRSLHERGYRIWYDEGIDPGNEWPDEVARALAGAALFLVFITPAAVLSKNVRNEINFALNRGKRFLAVYLDETQLPEGLEMRMGDIQAIMAWRMTPEHVNRKIEKSIPRELRELPDGSQAAAQPVRIAVPGASISLGAGPAWAPLVPYEFDTVRLNATAEVVERRTGQANYFSEELGGGVTLKMVHVPPGTFTMGSPETEERRSTNESPQHQVQLPAFFMGVFPVTQAQWRAVTLMPEVNGDLNADPSKFKGADLPVEQVSWDDATEFCARLSKKTRREYRLPSEAEWEYACRAGTSTPFAFGETITPEFVNYAGNPYGQAPKGEYRSGTVAVGSLGVANGFGLYDMHGNVWEWCEDVWHGDYNAALADGSAWLRGGDESLRVLRGGSWVSLGNHCRAASRNWYTPDYRYDNLGFRVVGVGRTR